MSNANSCPTAHNINTLGPDLLPIIFQHLSPHFKLNTLRLVNWSFHEATFQKKSWSSIKTLSFSRNTRQLRDPTKIQLPIEIVTRKLISDYDRLIVLLINLKCIEFPDFVVLSGNELSDGLILSSVRDHISKLTLYKSTFCTSFSKKACFETLFLPMVQLMGTQPNLVVSELVLDARYFDAPTEYLRFLLQFNTTQIRIFFLGDMTTNFMDSEACKYLQGKCIPKLTVDPDGAVDNALYLINQLKPASLKSLHIRSVLPDLKPSEFYSRINKQQLQALETLNLSMHRWGTLASDCHFNVEIPKIMQLMPALRCLKMRELSEKELSDLIAVLWHYKRLTATCHIGMKIHVSASQFLNNRYVRSLQLQLEKDLMATNGTDPVTVTFRCSSSTANYDCYCEIVIVQSDKQFICVLGKTVWPNDIS